MKEVHEFFGDFIPIDTDHYTLSLMDGLQLCRPPVQWKMVENQIFHRATDVKSCAAPHPEHPGGLPGAEAAPVHPLPGELGVRRAPGARGAASDRARGPARRSVRLPRELPAGDHGPPQRPGDAAADAVAVPGHGARVLPDLEQPREADDGREGGGVRAERADRRFLAPAQVGQLRRPLHGGEAADGRLRRGQRAQGGAAE